MINFCKADIGRKEYKAVKGVMKSGWLTTGKVTKQFEDEFADYVGSEYAVAVSSCTAALKLCLAYLQLPKKSLVIVPSFTFCATAQAAEHIGLELLFGDIKYNDLCLDNESFIVKNGLKLAKAIVPVHLGGNKAYTNYNIPVVIDSAHRIEKNQCIDDKYPSCFSFYPTKNMTTGEGGMVATNDKNLYEWLLKARSHGRNVLSGHSYEVEFSGWKANMPDILAAIGLVQLRKLPEMTDKRNQVVKWYNEYLGREWTGNHLYPYFPQDRNKFMQFMLDNKVQCSAHFNPLHKMKAYTKHNKFKLLVTEDLGSREVSLPLYPGLKKRQVKKICNLIHKYEQNERTMYQR